MGNSPRDGNSYGRPARANPTARAIYKPPVDKNGQTVITDDLKGMAGGAWTPDQIKAGGRWEVPAGAPAGAIGRNFVQYAPPAAPAAVGGGGRDALAHMIAMAASNNGRSYPQRDFWSGSGGGGAWMNGGR